MIDRFISWLYTRKIWGSRCVEYDPECHCCEAWAIHDWLFNGLAHPEERNEAVWAGQERPMTGIIQQYVRNAVPNALNERLKELAREADTGKHIDTSRMSDEDFIRLVSRENHP